MDNWRELCAGENGRIVFPIVDGSTLKAALVPVKTSTLSGLSSNTDYWLGAAPSTWPSSFNMTKVERTTPTSATAARSYTAGTVTITSWHETPLEKFVHTTTTHTFTSGRRWKAKVPELRTTEDHYIYLIWNGSDFEWVVTSEDTADQIDIGPSTVLQFSEISNSSIDGVKAVDV